MYDSVGAKGIWEISVPPCQFYCKLKTALKKGSLIKQTNKNEWMPQSSNHKESQSSLTARETGLSSLLLQSSHNKRELPCSGFSALWCGGYIPYDPQGKLRFEHQSGTQVFTIYGSYFSSLQDRENTGPGRMWQPNENCSDIPENVTMVSFVLFCFFKIMIMILTTEVLLPSAQQLGLKQRQIHMAPCRSTMQICKVSSTAMKNDLLLNLHFHCPLSIPWWAGSLHYHNYVITSAVPSRKWVPYFFAYPVSALDYLR